jgi:SdrD B-like domain
MEGGLAPDDSGLSLQASSYNAAGWPRTWRVDYALISQRGPGTATTRAIGLGGFLDTPNHGALSVNANLVGQRTDVAGLNAVTRGSTFRIDQRGLPLGDGWFANHSAGDINTGSTLLGRGLGRVALPTAPIRGVGGQWIQGDRIDLNASVGRTGLFNGLDVSGFQTSGGQLASAGAQARLPLDASTGRGDAAVQFIDGRGISDTGGSASRQDTSAMWAALSWEGRAPWSDALAAGGLPVGERVGGLRVQGNLLRSASSRDGDATGVWADALWRTGLWRNTAGVFRFDPGLRWGSYALAGDLQGAYWQADFSSRRWQAGYTAELSDSVSGRTGTGLGSAIGRSAFFNANGRYRIDSRDTVGAALSVRTLSTPGEAAALSWDHLGGWGQTQWRGDFSRTGALRSGRVGFDHAWALSMPATLNTSLAFERSAGLGMPSTSGVIWGLIGTVSPATGWTVDAALRGSRRSDGGSFIYSNVGLNWHAYGGWSVLLRYAESRGQEPLAAAVLSSFAAATLQAQPLQQSSRSVQLLLRYEGRAGSPGVPLGGVAGAGSGGISGTVFYDTDADGKRQASEAGVPGVTVLLDRRYVTRTDAQGRYEFPSVSADPHLLEISPDNVPLPWSPALKDPVRLAVPLRQTVTQDFPVQRER